MASMLLYFYKQGGNTQKKGIILGLWTEIVPKNIFFLQKTH